jgi:hypothetical protein
VVTAGLRLPAPVSPTLVRPPHGRILGAREDRRYVDLVQALSHFRLSQNLERLTARDWHVLAPSQKKPLQTSKTRRDFGEVGDAVLQVLAEAGCERMMDIHAAVEDLLGEPVSRSSVKNYTGEGLRSPQSAAV